jgi:hypothetical protein
VEVEVEVGKHTEDDAVVVETLMEEDQGWEAR